MNKLYRTQFFRMHTNYAKQRRKARCSKMSYDVFPYWLQQKEDDYFSYPLRTKEEVYYQLYLNPPRFDVNIYKILAVRNFNTSDTCDQGKYSKVRMEIDMLTMGLYPQQLERMIFLLGPRYKNDLKLKLSVHEAPDFDTNLGYGVDKIKQIYFEALRAPLRLHNRSFQEEEMITKEYGGIQEYNKICSFYENKKTTEYKSFIKLYPKMIDKTTSYAQKIDFWNDLIEKNKLSKQEKITELTLNQKLDNKIDEIEQQLENHIKLNKDLSTFNTNPSKLNHKDFIRKEIIVKEESLKLTKEAYDLFYKH